MPLAVTHVLLTIILVDLYRDYLSKSKEYFTLHTVFIAGVFGLLPDIDVVFVSLSNILNFSLPSLMQHGGFTHTPLFGLIFLIPGLILWKMDKKKIGCYFFVAAFGILFHVFLDYLFGGGAYEGIMLLFPLSTEVWKIHLLNYFSFVNIPKSLDAIILLLWLWHEEMKHKISDFI